MIRVATTINRIREFFSRPVLSVPAEQFTVDSVLSTECDELRSAIQDELRDGLSRSKCGEWLLNGEGGGVTFVSVQAKDWLGLPVEISGQVEPEGSVLNWTATIDGVRWAAGVPFAKYWVEVEI